MSKDESTVNKDANEPNQIKKSNIKLTKICRDKPEFFEKQVNTYFFGEPGDSNNKAVKPVARKEVFYYGLGVKAEDVELIYNKKEPSFADYANIPKYYKDDYGNIKEYNNAQELIDISKERTEVHKLIGQYASTNYSYSAKKEIEQIMFSTRFTSKAVARESFDTAVETTTAAVESKPEVEASQYAVINCNNSYQKALNDTKEELEKYKQIAEILKNPDNMVAYSSEEKDISGDKPTPQDLKAAMIILIMDCKNVTGLDPRSEDFTKNLDQLDPTKLGKIEIPFKKGNDLIMHTVNQNKFIKILKKVDPKLLLAGDYESLEREGRDSKLQAVKDNLKGVNLSDTKLISLVDNSNLVSLDKKQDSKLINFKNKVSRLYAFKKKKIDSQQDINIESEKAFQKDTNTVFNDKSQKVSQENLNIDIVFPDKAQQILKDKELLSAKGVNSSHLDVEPLKSSVTPERPPLVHQDATINLDTKTKTNSITTNSTLEAVSKQGLGSTQQPEPLSAPLTTLEIPKEAPSHKWVKGEVSYLKNKRLAPELEAAKSSDAQTVEGPKTEKGFRPLPPTPAEKVSTAAKKRPQPLTPEQMDALKVLQETLKKEGMQLKSDIKISNTSTNITISAHRTKKNDGVPTR